MKNCKVWFGIACMAVCGLAFSLAACEGDDAMSSSRPDSDGDNVGWDSLSQINMLNPESLLHCDRRLTVDGLIVARYSPLGNVYYKCENDEWSMVPADDVANKDSVMLLITSTQLGERDFYMFQKCEADNEGMIDSVNFTGYHGVKIITYYKCEQGTWKTVPENETVDDEKDSAYCDTLKVAAPPYECNESLMVDGYYYAFTGHVYPGLGGCTFKCQHNEWSFVPAKDVPEDAKRFSDYDITARPKEVGMLNFKKCNADNEGLLDSLSTGSGNPKGGSARVYYRCEQENWVESPVWVACDTAGVSEGEICRLQTSSRGSQFGSDIWECYRYAGNGAWEEQECEDSSDDPADSNSVQEE